MRRLSLKQIPLEERPREKLIQKGAEALTDAELLGIVLTAGTPEESAVQIAQRMLSDGREELESLSVHEMCRKYRGIGPARAAQVKAALELARRRTHKKHEKQPRFSNSRMVFEFCQASFHGKHREEFWVLALDAKNRLQKQEAVSRGTLMGSLVHPREVFELAIRNAAAGIIVLHNHPSGDPEPSPEDRRVTTQLAEAGRVLGIPLLDHLIIGNGSYYSFKDHGGL
ncbi:MAG TPA: DNA repair protein RadC [Acidobacteriota bacterium]|nr:DNA repair protein RadC [Acidobacteriota bacterium]